MKMDEMKGGDIFRWSYKEAGDDRDYGRYHCCSRIAVFNGNGRLRDTFWSSANDGRSFGEDDLSRIDLIYLGNFSDLEKSNEYQADYYDESDIVNLNHSNDSRGNFYLRKGAKRSAPKMLEVARRKLQDAEYDERSAIEAQGKMRAVISQIESGNTDIYL